MLGAFLYGPTDRQTDSGRYKLGVFYFTFCSPLPVRHRRGAGSKNIPDFCVFYLLFARRSPPVESTTSIEILSLRSL